MRTIKSEEITRAVKDMILQANFELDKTTLEALRQSKDAEASVIGKHVLGEILNNAEIAAAEKMPLCQDTGAAIFFVEWGQEVVLEGMVLQETIDEAVRQAYEDGHLRKSIVKDPIFDRANTGDNTPAIVHQVMVPGDKVKLRFLAKGSGADNCSQLTMLRPADGIDGVKEFVLKVCKEAGASSCPPWILGIGIGGTFDTVAALSKLALLREIGSRHTDQKILKFEETLLNSVNKLGIGPQGLGGDVSALACFVEVRPCHAASLPVAVNIQCHSNRKAEIII